MSNCNDFSQEIRQAKNDLGKLEHRVNLCQMEISNNQKIILECNEEIIKLSNILRILNDRSELGILRDVFSEFNNDIRDLKMTIDKDKREEKISKLIRDIELCHQKAWWGEM